MRLSSIHSFMYDHGHAEFLGHLHFMVIYHCSLHLNLFIRHARDQSQASRLNSSYSLTVACFTAGKHDGGALRDLCIVVS